VLVVGRINSELIAAPTHVTVRHDRRDRPAIDDVLRLEVPPSVGDESARLDSPIGGSSEGGGRRQRGPSPTVRRWSAGP
jgi:hypothetical protein